MNPIDLSIFASRLNAICEEMGAALGNAAFSPNIRDRLDFSCALFDARGQLCAQAAHIPVHLGSMAFAMGDLVARMAWQPGDMVILNDPFLGGTHLPDVTLIAPVFSHHDLRGFVVNRAHHADIGAPVPGSMPVSRSLQEEGQIIAPMHLIRRGELWETGLNRILEKTRNPAEVRGDLMAQISANRIGVKRLQALMETMNPTAYEAGLQVLNDYGERLAQTALDRLPTGTYEALDWMEDDGQGNKDLPIRLRLTLAEGRARLDFSGTAPQVPGNINCPLSVVAAAVFYVFRCLMPPQTPACAGSFRPLQLEVPAGCLLNARFPAAVAAGNVETSSRVVDVVMKALALALPQGIPAASQGTMNNLALGSTQPGAAWDYYETIGGGMGAGPARNGLSGVQTHMTNTRNTPVEILESRYPLRLVRYCLRRGSGGAGLHRGGDGLIREFELQAPAQVSLLTERRTRGPWGLAGGEAGKPGRNLLNGKPLPGKTTLNLQPGDRLRIETPGGGGWGKAE